MCVEDPLCHPFPRSPAFHLSRPSSISNPKSKMDVVVVRRALEDGLDFEDRERTTRYLLVNAFATVGFMYLASVVGLNVRTGLDHGCCAHNDAREGQG